MRHQQLHRQQHIDMCNSINQIQHTSNESFHFRRRLNQEEWIVSRKQFMNLVKFKLSRDLEPYEKQIILFAKSCLICHQQIDLKTCRRCYSSNYCIEHMEAFQNKHYFSCDGLQLCFNLASNFPYDYTYNNELVKCPIEDKPVVDMKSFILQYIREERNINDPDTFTVEEHICSDYVSAPLTLYYQMRNLNLLNFLDKQRSFCVVHIIAASSVDKKYVAAWELLLHFLYETRELKLVLIGLELNNESNNIEVCSRCDNMCQRFTLESYGMMYDTYVNSEYYIQPNVIVGFQTDFSDVEMWSTSLIVSQNQNCPFLVTAESKFKSNLNISNIERALGGLLNLIHNDENEFSSTMPCRDFENDSVFYRNKYVAVFDNFVSMTWPPSSIQM
ncbi:uncharacterized protein LOC116846873 isoform X2 [Odontomachus brunneus]|nr:uncharacterized protein LOC116846873 isoform X2 [Odontomachus brunneus]